MAMWHFDILNAVLCMLLIHVCFTVQYVTGFFYLSFHTKIFSCLHMYKLRGQFFKKVPCTINIRYIIVTVYDLIILRQYITCIILIINI